MKLCSTYSLIAICLILLGSCAKDGGEMTRRGYEYTHHVDKGDRVAVPGEYAYFHIVMRFEDSILNTSHGMADIPRIRIPSPEEFTAETPVIVDAFEIMGLGDSLTLFYPLDSLENIPPEFAHIDVIEYDLTLIDIKTDEAFKAEMEAVMKEREEEALVVQARKDEVSAFAEQTVASFNNGNLDMQTSPSGLQYIIHEPGSGDMPSNGDMVAVQYYGTYLDGRMFDTSFNTGMAYSFPLGQQRVIRGWDEGVGYLKPGAKASLIVPPALAYGETGYMDIPGNTTLYFYVELEKVN